VQVVPDKVDAGALLEIIGAGPTQADVVIEYDSWDDLDEDDNMPGEEDYIPREQTQHEKHIEAMIQESVNRQIQENMPMIKALTLAAKQNRWDVEHYE
jgi:hypothetical protein